MTNQSHSPRTVRGTATIHEDDRIEFKPYAEGEPAQRNVRSTKGGKDMCQACLWSRYFVALDFWRKYSYIAPTNNTIRSKMWKFSKKTKIVSIWTIK